MIKDEGVRKLESAVKRLGVKIHEDFEHIAPMYCPVCRSHAVFNGRHDFPMRRHGWCRYTCGRKWHPVCGWNKLPVDGCEAKRFKDALVVMSVTRATAKMIRSLAIEVLNFGHLLDYKKGKTI